MAWTVSVGVGVGMGNGIVIVSGQNPASVPRVEKEGSQYKEGRVQTETSKKLVDRPRRGEG